MQLRPAADRRRPPAGRPAGRSRTRYPGAWAPGASCTSPAPAPPSRPRSGSCGPRHSAPRPPPSRRRRRRRCRAAWCRSTRALGPTPPGPPTPPWSAPPLPPPPREDARSLRGAAARVGGTRPASRVRGRLSVDRHSSMSSSMLASTVRTAKGGAVQYPPHAAPKTRNTRPRRPRRPVPSVRSARALWRAKR